MRFCYGCIPTPQAQTSICFNPCSLSGLRVLITATSDYNCAYTAIATCTNTGVAEADMQFNGGGPNFAYPQTLICDALTGIYTYTNMAGIQEQANSIECVCRANNCVAALATYPQSTIFTPAEGSGPPTNVPDNNCYYYHQITCADPTRTMIQFMRTGGGSDLLPEDQTIFCPAGYTGYFYTTTAGTIVEALGDYFYCPP
uniref:Uncharacterized protein n=2 Tax=Panagrolaimus sp. ES5 TaxID=591445 RepID=A0AC34F2S4_9BILA